MSSPAVCLRPLSKRLHRPDGLKAGLHGITYLPHDTPLPFGAHYDLKGGVRDPSARILFLYFVFARLSSGSTGTAGGAPSAHFPPPGSGPSHPLHPAGGWERVGTGSSSDRV